MQMSFFILIILLIVLLLFYVIHFTVSSHAAAASQSSPEDRNNPTVSLPCDASLQEARNQTWRIARTGGEVMEKKCEDKDENIAFVR